MLSSKMPFGPFDAKFSGRAFFFSSRRRHTSYIGDWSSDACSSDLDRTSARLPSAGPNQLIALVQRSDSPALHAVVGGAPIEKVQKPKFGKRESVGLLAALIILRSEERRVGKESKTGKTT